MTQPNGTPVWFELASPDPKASGQIYGPVAEWQVAPSPNPAHGGHVIAGPDKATGVAGIMAAPEGIAVGRSVYFAAANADALAAHAVALGGAVRASPIDIPDVGRIALLADPQGVAFSVMAGVGADSSQAFVASDPAEEPAIGHGVCTELTSPDPAGAFVFHGALFGWTRAGSMPMGAMGEYPFIGNGDGPVPGAIMSSTATGAPARWSWYVHVADIDQALDRVRAAGGTVRQGPDPISGGGFSANIADPHGVGMGLVGQRSATERG